MPRIKSRLNRQEKQEHATSLRALQSEGIDVDVPEESLRNTSPLSIEVCYEFGAVVSDVSRRGGPPEYSVPLRLTASRPLTLIDCFIVTEWDDQIELQSLGPHNPKYCASITFFEDEVLNARIEHGLRLSGVLPVQGHIVATGMNPIPDGYLHDTPALGEIVLLDREGTEFRQKVYFRVSRAQLPKKTISKGESTAKTGEQTGTPPSKPRRDS